MFQKTFNFRWLTQDLLYIYPHEMKELLQFPIPGSGTSGG